jgi:hypothetical protein
MRRFYGHRRTSKCRFMDLLIGSPAFAIGAGKLRWRCAYRPHAGGIVAVLLTSRVSITSWSTVISRRSIFPAGNWPKICTVSATEFAHFLRNLMEKEEMVRVFSKIACSRAFSGLTPHLHPTGVCKKIP